MTAVSVDAAIDELIAGGASLADHEGLWPSLRELRTWYWAQAYRDRAEAIDSWRALMVAFGAPPDEAEAYAREWADTHGYRGRQHPRPGRGPTYIAAIKAQIPIEVVARELTELRQGRDSLKGRCPFHDDRDPSFVVWPARGIWRCYGACAEGGDIIRLWRRAHEKGLVR